MTAFADAVQRLQEAETSLQAAHAIVNAAEREHGPDSAEADAAIQGPQGTACDAHSAAEEALAQIPASTAQEALLKAHLLLNEAQMSDILKAVRDDIARFVDASTETASTNAQTPNQALKDIASISRDLSDIDSPVASIAAIMKILNQLAAGESFESDAGNLDLSNAMFWLSRQGLDALKELDGMGSRIHRLASMDA